MCASRLLPSHLLNRNTNVVMVVKLRVCFDIVCGACALNRLFVFVLFIFIVSSSSNEMGSSIPPRDT